MLGPKQHCSGTIPPQPPTLFHYMKYKELFSTLPKTQLWLPKDSGCPPPTWRLLARELRNSSRCYGMEHIKDSLWGLRRKRGLWCRGVENLCWQLGANEPAKYGCTILLPKILEKFIFFHLNKPWFIFFYFYELWCLWLIKNKPK